jgi:hypothetical protein
VLDADDDPADDAFNYHKGGATGRAAGGRYEGAEMGTESPHYPDWMSDAAVERRKWRFLGCVAVGLVALPLLGGLAVFVVWLLIGRYRYFN